MPFCPQCGYEMKSDAKFCYRCGLKIELPPDPPSRRGQWEQTYTDPNPAIGSAAFREYLKQIRGRFQTESEFSNALNAFCFRDSQLSTVSVMSFTKHHYHIFIRYSSGTDPQEPRTFADVCLENVWAMPHHNSLSLNTFAVPVLCADRGNDNLFRSLDGGVKKKTGFSFSCATYPVILTLADGQLHYPTNTPMYGAAVYHTVKKMIGDNLYFRV